MPTSKDSSIPQTAEYIPIAFSPFGRFYVSNAAPYAVVYW